MTVQDFQNTVIPLKRKLFVVAFRLVGQAQDAEDMVQDIMIRIWEQQQPLDTYNNIEAYLMTLVRNRSLDRLKYNKLRRGGEAQTDVVSSEPTPDYTLERAESHQHVQRMVRSLPDSQREILILRDFVGYSYQDIAEITGMDLNRVKVGIHRARKSLKRLLSKDNHYGVHTA